MTTQAVAMNDKGSLRAGMGAERARDREGRPLSGRATQAPTARSQLFVPRHHD